jgi:hypothetical protein
MGLPYAAITISREPDVSAEVTACLSIWGYATLPYFRSELPCYNLYI